MNADILFELQKIIRENGLEALDDIGITGKALTRNVAERTRRECDAVMLSLMADYHKELAGADVAARNAVKKNIAMRLCVNEGLDKALSIDTADLLEAVLFAGAGGIPAAPAAPIETKTPPSPPQAPQTPPAAPFPPPQAPQTPPRQTPAAPPPSPDPSQAAPAEMVFIEGGTFMMGSPETEPGRSGDEAQHSVTVSSFYMGNYTVTQREGREVMGKSPSHFRGDELPVETVTWYDAVKYCNKRSKKERLRPTYTINWKKVTWNQDANGYRLPTEAEWEYACRAGTTTPYYTGDTVEGAGWYSAISEKTTHPAGQKQPNAWDLYDMHGNVYEWCWDRYRSYQSEAQTDPVGAGTGPARVIRGGSWHSYAGSLRSADRYYSTPEKRYDYLGFRLARSSS
jgi:formylglycine-generating enzyme required for sulfatase activity